MTTSNLARAAAAALIGAALSASLAGSPAHAEIKNYEFQLTQPTVQVGTDRIVTVRLVDRTTGKSIPDAIIFATRLDMAPDAMQEMVTKVTPMPGTEPGTYRFKATFGMAGRWQLSLGAKVQGETGSVENKLVVTAEK
ncbi:conserved exported protein implied in the cusBA heavy metal efflux RND system [Bradyrhizobium sp. LTSPM299]|uniref:FixH family protein n=1 Tax=Bradyrhizobium sp. LTSPM299 TaxID=1619233 RepID=UPI0005CADADB|nr:FixH family protein [Bradyrhizobium sp. LTSPM299]KJC62273.1 conserved exported protein implied in the cusBA heavy metal efflux RND system [Bradyrhizobium sp. LTSPM299]